MRSTQPSGLEVVSEVSDLAAGAGMLIFAFAPFALPALSLTALVAVAVLIPALVGGALVAPFLMARRWRRLRDRLSVASEPSGRGNAKARAPRRRPATALGRSGLGCPAELDRLSAPTSPGGGEGS